MLYWDQAGPLSAHENLLLELQLVDQLGQLPAVDQDGGRGQVVEQVVTVPILGKGFFKAKWTF